MGHLHALWHVALEQAEDGDLSRWSDEEIAEAADYPGDAPQCVKLLQDHGWLDGKLIHDWVDYAGFFLTRKYSTRNRERLVEIWQMHGRVYGDPVKRAEGEQQVKGERKVGEQKANLPNLTVPNQPNLTNQGEERAPARELNGAETVKLDRELQRVCRRIDEINGSVDSHQTLEPFLRAERKMLKERREVLRKMLGVVC